jgi:hypothetical protein
MPCRKHLCFQRPIDSFVQKMLDNSTNSVQREQNCTSKKLLYVFGFPAEFNGRVNAAQALKPVFVNLAQPGSG